MTNKEITQIYSGLVELRESSTANFPTKVSYAIIRNIKILEPLVEINISMKNDLLRKYGVPNQDGTFYISEEVSNDFSKEINEINALEVNPIDFYTIKYSDIEDINLSIKEMDALFFMIVEE